MFSPKTREIRLAAEKDPGTITLLESLLNEKTVVYIDFGNVSGWPRKLNWEIDLRRLKDFLDSFGVIQARFYFGTTPQHDGSARFMTFVYKTGYKVRTKPVKTIRVSIDVSSISEKSPDILNNFIKDQLLVSRYKTSEGPVSLQKKQTTSLRVMLYLLNLECYGCICCQALPWSLTSEYAQISSGRSLNSEPAGFSAN